MYYVKLDPRFAHLRGRADPAMTVFTIVMGTIALALIAAMHL